MKRKLKTAELILKEHLANPSKQELTIDTRLPFGFEVDVIGVPTNDYKNPLKMSTHTTVKHGVLVTSIPNNFLAN